MVIQLNKEIQYKAEPVPDYVPTIPKGENPLTTERINYVLRHAPELSRFAEKLGRERENITWVEMDRECTRVELLCSCLNGLIKSFGMTPSL